MDGLFRTFGVRNVTVIIDEIPDATKKINVGARDMFMSATSQMTRTTHAIRLVPMVESRVFSESKRERLVADADFVNPGLDLAVRRFDAQKQRDGAVLPVVFVHRRGRVRCVLGPGLDFEPGRNLRHVAGSRGQRQERRVAAQARKPATTAT